MFPPRSHRDAIKDALLLMLVFGALIAFGTWAGLSGWVDGADPFPGIDLVPDWLEGR